MEQERIAICYQCNSQGKEIPLISTFAFRGSEVYCPECKNAFGIFNTKVIDSTPELQKQLKKSTKANKEYLDARSSLACQRIKIKGEWVETSTLGKEWRDNKIAIVKKYEPEL